MKHWSEALLLFKPDTLLRGHPPGFRLDWKFKSRTRGGRPRIAIETMALLQQMAKENRLWGAKRIPGERLKLGRTAAKHTLQNYIARLRPPKPPSQPWSTFLKHHTKEIWACDFLPGIDVWFRPLPLCFLIALASRRVVHLGVTRSPAEAWVAQPRRAATPFGQTPRFFIRDRDRQDGAAFPRVAAGSSIEIWKTPARAPKANAICERFLGSVRREGLDPVLVLGENHLHRVIRESIDYFNRARPQQGIEPRIPEGMLPVPVKVEKAKIIAFPVLNGLHHGYRRAA